MVRSNCIPGVNPRHTRTPRFPATTVLMAKSQRYRDPYWCSRWPIYTHCYCPAPIHQTHSSMKDSSLFSIPLFHAGKQGSTSPLPCGKTRIYITFSQLDALYVHIKEQIPENIIIITYLLLSYFSSWNANTRSHISILCCMFRIFQHMRYLSPSACRTLQRGIFQTSQLNRPLHRPHTAVFWPTSMVLSRQVNHIFGVHSKMCFYHTSFHDFLRDPIHSSAFCVNTPAFYYRFLDHLIQCHHNYASGYAIDDSSMYSPCICPCTCHSRACVGTGYR